MKKFAGMTFATLALCALTSLTFAKGKSHWHTISFSDNTIVHGTVVKKGDYQAKFDEQTNEFEIMNGSHVVATAKATEESLNHKAEETTYDLHASDAGPVLTEVTFGGDHYKIKVEQ